MLDRIPTEEDWDNWDDVYSKSTKSLWDLDIKYAKENFLGKSHEECFLLFQDGIGIHGDDFYAMPRKCFRYYIFALAQYFVRISERPHRTEEEKMIRADYQEIHCFFSFICFRLEHDIDTIASIFKELWPYIDKILKNEDKFVAEVEKHICGDFRVKAEEIKTLAQKAKIKI